MRALLSNVPYQYCNSESFPFALRLKVLCDIRAGIAEIAIKKQFTPDYRNFFGPYMTRWLADDIHN